MFTKEETEGLNAIFTLARQATTNDENTLIQVINFKKSIMDKYAFQTPQTMGEKNAEKTAEAEPATA